MIYNSSIGKLNFWDPYEDKLNRFKNIGINLSGGADSSLLLFMTCRELEHRKKFNVGIIPITGVHNLRPTNEWNVREIVLLFKEWFPNLNWKDHEFNYYDKKHEKDKTNQHVQHEDRLREEKIIDVLFHGRTANPPEDVAKENNLLYKREERRDQHGNLRQPYHENHDKPFYCPMEFLDKRFVSEQYKKFNLMDELFPITASCVEYSELTSFFSEPCKECWWCREKKWAFGMYDGGVK